MLHSPALKLIGQALESAQIEIFKIAKKWSDEYQVCVGRTSFRWDPTSLPCLPVAIPDRQTSLVTEGRFRPYLAEQLRAVGDYIDRKEVDEFRIVWTPSFALLDYEQADLMPSQRVFTAEELQELARRPTLPRSISYLPPRLNYWS